MHQRVGIIVITSEFCGSFGVVGRGPDPCVAWWSCASSHLVPHAVRPLLPCSLPTGTPAGRHSMWAGSLTRATTPALQYTSAHLWHEPHPSLCPWTPIPRALRL